MDDLTLFIAIFASLAVILISLLFLKSKQSQQSSETKTGGRRRVAAVPNRDEDGQIVDVGPRGRRGPAGRRMQRRQQAAEEIQEPVDDGSNEPIEGSDDDELSQVAKELPGKLGKKKQQKLQDKAEKKLQREAELQEREERKKRLEKEEEERKKGEEMEKELERKQEEEEQRIREEKERKEYEEYLKLKETFTMEEEGFDEEAGVDEENKLEIFIQYIKDTKVVLLEDLAAHFKMKTQDAIDRVTTLRDEGKLTGVIDDRGKFIYISQAELETVAKFINNRGRVSITELAENSNRLVSLNS